MIASVALSACATAHVTPVADHHQHIFSPDIVRLLDTSGVGKAITARDLIAMLDSARIQKALLLSPAYLYGSPSRHFADEYARVRAENDWDAAQAAQYPGRLIAFCGINPLKDYALAEVERCSRDPNLKRGIKLHFGNSDVQLENPEHAAKVRKIFEAANTHGMAIVVHMRASLSRKRPYGPEQARVFLDQLVTAAPNVMIQVAHLASTGPGYDDPPADSVMDVFADAIKRHDPRMKNVWFDVASIANVQTPETAAKIARRIREVGVERVVYGSDSAFGDNLRPRESWAAFRRIPLTEEEFRAIAGNVAPYFK